mgnify:CR=1 FL=1
MQGIKSKVLKEKKESDPGYWKSDFSVAFIHSMYNLFQSKESKAGNNILISGSKSRHNPSPEGASYSSPGQRPGVPRKQRSSPEGAISTSLTAIPQIKNTQ